MAFEMPLVGASTASVQVDPATVSSPDKKIYARIDDWRQRKIEGEHPYVLLDGIVMKRTWAGEVRNVSLLVAIGVTTDGDREILGIMEGPREDKSGWSAFLRHLVDRGLSGVQLVVSDARRGLVESAAEFLPNARWQRRQWALGPMAQPLATVVHSTATSSAWCRPARYGTSPGC